MGEFNFKEFLKETRNDWGAHNRDWTLPGFRAVFVCRFGQWRMTIRTAVLRAPMSLLYRAMYRRVRNVYGIELPYSVILGRGVIIEHQGAIVIHGSARIGDGCILRQGVTIGNRYLEHPLEAPTIGKNVNIGAGAKILGKVDIGNNVVIGANAVVLEDIEANQVAVGVPATIVGKK